MQYWKNTPNVNSPLTSSAANLFLPYSFEPQKKTQRFHKEKQTANLAEQDSRKMGGSSASISVFNLKTADFILIEKVVVEPTHLKYMLVKLVNFYHLKPPPSDVWFRNWVL